MMYNMDGVKDCTVANVKRVLSVVLAAATLAMVLTYVIGGQALLQSPYAEPAHNLFMSLMSGIADHTSRAQMHGGPASEPQIRSEMHGIIGNNVLGGPSTLPAGGLAVVVVASAIALAAGAFVVSWNQRSFLVAGLLAASGIILMIPALIATGYFVVIIFPGPIIGVILGLMIFGLGVAKGIRTARTAVAPAAR